LAKALLRDLGIFPQKDATAEARDKQERLLLTLDEFERGYPRLTLSLFLDVVGFCKAAVNKTAFTPYNEAFRTDDGKAALKKRLEPKEMPGSVSSWGKVLSLLWRMHRLKVFDRHGGGSKFLNYRELIQP